MLARQRVESRQLGAQQRIVAEQFAPVVNSPIAVYIADKQGVPRIHPAGRFGETIAFMVKMRFMPHDGRCPDSVAIQIQNERTDSRTYLPLDSSVYSIPNTTTRLFPK